MSNIITFRPAYSLNIHNPNPIVVPFKMKDGRTPGFHILREAIGILCHEEQQMELFNRLYETD